MALHKSPPRTASTRRTLVGLLLIPLLSLAGLWGFTASITVGNVIRDQHYNAITNGIAPSTVGLEQALQAERELTFAWLSADRQSPQLRTQLLAARHGTDAMVMTSRAATTSVRGLLGATGQARLSSLFTDLAGLSGIRTAVDSGADSPVTAFTAYNAILAAEFGFFNNATPPSDPTLGLIFQASYAEARAADFTVGAIGLVEGALATHGQMQPERVLLAQVVGEQNLEIDDMFAVANPELTALFGQVFDSAAYRQLLAAESRILSSPANRPVPVKAADFQTAGLAIQAAERSVLPQLGGILAAREEQLHNSLLTELYLAAGLGLAAVVVSVLIMVRFARRLRGELTGLYDSARQMAGERLPRLVDRLRHGEDVDVETESPPLRTGRITEIANVAQAFTAVQRTAVEAAVGQAALRKGVNQVFVSLSLRNQSLLHRQLGMLDEMERVTSDPVALADLFRLDHLTTRMRRHAEGLLILAGSTPGRGWRDPVPVADVLTAAVAEVEDYVRVDVVTEAADAVAGAAVNDIIHLLAELIENANVFSPPNARVEIRGDGVGHGFAIEVEDRGLGMPADEIAALNARLARPPEFDLANSDQLGLFVAARLAERHAVKISLRQSPFGGTTAIVLLPPAIIVPADGTGWAPDAADPGEQWSAPAGGASGPGTGERGFGLTGRHRRLGPVPEASPVPRARSAPLALEPPALGPAYEDMPAPSRELPVPPWELPAPQQPGRAPAAGGWFGRIQAPDLSAGPSTADHIEFSDAEFGGAEFGDITTAGGSRPGLPRRARGTNLAPQLRRKLSSASGDRDGPGSPAWPGATGAAEPPDRSPEEASSLLSALQDGWERARIDDLDYFEGEEQ
jgi:signal transduction histidine kinase